MKFYCFTITSLLLASILAFGQKKEILPYKNPSLSIEARAQDLLSRMTLEEKIGQMTQIATTEINNVTDPKKKADRFQPFLSESKAADFIKNQHVGSFLASFAVLPQQWYDFSFGLQKVNMANSRLGIPIIYGNDHIHGANYVTGATIFPQPYNLAATFERKYARAMGEVTAAEISDLGQHWNFAPVLDIGRNPYWPRQYETMGEDTYLVSELGVQYIQGLQESQAAAPYKVAACAKHFLGYSDPKSGDDRAPAYIPLQDLRETFLPPFKAAIAAGVKTFMVNSGDINGEPLHASARYINGLLRKELGFDGVIVTDWADILQLVGQHHVAANEKEATRLALMAGIDMSMTATTVTFCKVTKELVEEGALPIEVIDAACLRILKLKFDLGLFENPYPRKDRFARIGSAANKALAKQAAEESIVLLQNKGALLPLPEKTKILIAGPATASKRNLSGGWTIEWSGAPEARFPSEMPTLADAVRKAFPNAEVDTTATLPYGKLGNPQAFAAKCSKADVVILALGEEPYAEGNGNIRDLQLPADQLEMVRLAKASGKKTIGIMVAGRPRVVPDIKNQFDAFIFAGLPCEAGGTAIAQILSGVVVPSGKLSVSYPATNGHALPYNHRVHDRSNAAWLFGAGEGYTTFQYSDLQLSDSVITQNQKIKVKVTVKNTGTKAAKEAVLFYIKDETRSIAPLVKSLRGFDKALIAAGEQKTFEFEILPSRDLAFPDDAGRQRLEDGYFYALVGGLQKRFLLAPKGGAQTMGKDAPRTYLQSELFD